MSDTPISTGKPDEKLEFATAFKAIQIALDDYNDIFSDFDTSPYSHRTISDDFLNEIERRYVKTESGEFEVRLTIADAKRDQKLEAVIKKRLKDHFHAKLKEKENDVKKRKQRGFLKLFVGVLVEIAVFELPIGFVPSLATIFSVFGWYLMWSGYENLFEVPIKTADDLQFLIKFSKAHFYFIAEEAVAQVVERLPEPAPSLKE